MAKQLTLKPGMVIWIPCELKSGIFPNEQHVKIEVTVGDKETVSGFIPKEDIKPGDKPGRGLVRGVVLAVSGNKVAVVLRGDILSHSNPVTISLDWLSAVASVD